MGAANKKGRIKTVNYVYFDIMPIKLRVMINIIMKSCAIGDTIMIINT